MKRKWLAVGIILLFVGLAAAPVISANDDVVASKIFSIPAKEKMVSITVLEYKPDGTIEKSVVKMSYRQAIDYKSELKDINDLDSRLSLYKKYKLIPQNVTDETLRQGMEEKALRFQPEIEKIQSKISHWKNNNSLFQRIYKNFRCNVGGWIGGGFRILGGSSFITGYINGLSGFLQITWYLLRSIDLFQFHVGLLGYLRAEEGDLPDIDFVGLFCSYFLLGFVGYFILDPPLPTIFFTFDGGFVGHAVACFCFVGAELYLIPPNDI